jgi:GT2 family glycosyltransferase
MDLQHQCTDVFQEAPLSMSFQIAVIIPHYNDSDRLARCLAALVPQAGPDVEIVVADNSSTVDLTRVRTDFPTVRIVVEAARGAGPARNLGVARTTAPWLMFIDADCLPAGDWIATGRRIAREGTVIGGRVDVFHETPPPCSGAEAFEQVFAFRMQAYLTRDSFLGAGNLVTSREVFEHVGGFRPAVSEDKEWSQRAAATGYRLAFDHDLAVAHPSRQDWPALRHKWRRLTSEGFLLDGQGARLKWAGKALLMPLSVLAHLPRVLRAGGLSGLEKARACWTLLRIRCARMVWMLRQAGTGRA